MDLPNEPANIADAQERRQLFRIDETAILEVVEVSEAAIAEQTADHCFDESPAFKVMRELRGIDADGSATLRAIHDKAPEVALYLQSINRKIDTIGNAVASTLLSEDQKLQSIDLSEGGIGFNHDTRLQEGGNYAVKVWFHQTLVGVAAYINVVACHRDIEGGYHISCSFQSLPESDQQVIAKHIMQVQAREQRNRKDANRSD